MSLLKIGQQLSTTDGMSLTVEALIASGGQGGSSHKVRSEREYALKWYHIPATPEQGKTRS